MENYEKGETRKVSEDCLPLALDNNTVAMKVNYGSKIRNLMGFAMKKIKEPDVPCITWEGSGNAISKTVTCAEIMKRKVQGLHQFNYARYRRIEEYWEPKLEGLDRLKVNRDIPVLTVVLSKVPLQLTNEGYQKPGSRESFWESGERGEKRRAKQSGNHRNPRQRKGPKGRDSTKQAKFSTSEKGKQQSFSGKTKKDTDSSSDKR
ncbi:ribonuclease P protein subunit p25-like protein [Liolophura sinensis]|uniref:ribonuclease P protein subunit p25-like protein n=1 Tax=Liolophura sinensis TaxID=3198878 RepID=UPI0031594A95